MPEPVPPMEFDAAILRTPRAPLEISRVCFDGPLRHGQVLVDLAFSGICGKQLDEIAERAGPDPWLPHMLGHEGSGNVIACGDGVAKVRPGDPVVLHWQEGSGLSADFPLYRIGDERINAGAITTFNEFAVVPENRVTKITDGTDLKTACLFGCVATTGTGTVLNDAAAEAGQSLAVIGCGGVGLCAILAAAAVEAEPIIAIDTRAEALRTASEFGAHHGIDATKTNVRGAVMRMTDGRGAQNVIVTAASTAALQEACAISTAPGRIIMAGVPPDGETVSISSLDVHRGKTLTGSYGGGTFPDRHIPEYMKLNETGRMDYSRLIGMVVPLSRINEGIDAVQKSLAGRCVVDLRADQP